MKILVLGASGRTGMYVLNFAKERNIEVNAIVDIGAFNRGAKGTIGQRVFESLESDVREQGVEPKDREEL